MSSIIGPCRKPKYSIPDTEGNSFKAQKAFYLNDNPVL